MNTETEVFAENVNPIAVSKGVERTLKTSIHHDKEIFTELYNEWSELAELSNQHIYMSPEWVTNWWTYFGEHKNRSLHIITVRDGDHLVAIFPFYKGVSPIAGKIIEERLQLIGSGGSVNEAFGFLNDYGISDFMDFIVHPDYRKIIAKLFIRLLRSPYLSPYNITLNHLRDDSYIKEYLYPKLSDVYPQISAEQTDICPFIDLAGIENIQAFIKQSKSSARRRFRQTLRAIGDEEGYIIQEAENNEQVQHMIRHLIQLHQARWNEIGFPGAFHDKRYTEFFRQIVSTASNKNRLWVKQAIDADGVCAVRLLLKYNGRYFDYMTGFNDDSTSAKYRPGIGLLLNLVEESIQEPVNKIELLRGDEYYKYDFTEKHQKNWSLTIPASRFKNGSLPFTVKMLHACASVYTICKREILLLMVQYQKSGFVKMFGGYGKFRYNSIKTKFRDRFTS